MKSPAKETKPPRALLLGGLLMSKGEWISCANGHQILKAMKDIRIGEATLPYQFLYVDGTTPRYGERPHACSLCGLPGVKLYKLGTWAPYVEGRGWLR